MSKQLDEISPELAQWIAAQRIFFVATAPSSASGHLNCSPKGGDTFRLIGPRTAIYLDFTGSGAETAAHLRENGRIVLMFCAFEGSPRILRLHGKGAVIPRDDSRFAPLARTFPDFPALRAIVQVEISRISTSCGYSVPFFHFQGNRDTLIKWGQKKNEDELREYRQLKNRQSIDGLPAFD